MNKVLFTGASGIHQRFLNHNKPYYKAYAARHGYKFATINVVGSRQASWYKVQGFLSLFKAGFDAALWIDADMMIRDGRKDIMLEVPEEKHNAVVPHYTGDGEVPNHGMWFMRNTPLMLEYLQAIWDSTRWLHHGWWEQAAAMTLMGFGNIDIRPIKLETPTKYWDALHYLPAEWNFHIWDAKKVKTSQIRFGHATMVPDRLAALQAWGEEANSIWMQST